MCSGKVLATQMTKYQIGTKGKDKERLKARGPITEALARHGMAMGVPGIGNLISPRRRAQVGTQSKTKLKRVLVFMRSTLSTIKGLSMMAFLSRSMMLLQRMRSTTRRVVSIIGRRD